MGFQVHFIDLSNHILLLKHYLRIIQLNLRNRDNLRTKDKRPVPKVSLVWRFDCTMILLKHCGEEKNLRNLDPY